MLQKLGKLGKSIVFIGIAAALLYGLTILTLPKIPTFYEEEEWDVVFFGTSHSYMTFWPEEFEKYGLKTYNRGRPEQTLNFTYYYIKDALEVSKIDLIVLEVFGVHYGEGDSRYQNELVWENSLADFRYSDIKIDAIKDCVPKDRQWEYLFPLDKYHSNWEKWDFSSWENAYDSIFNPYYEEENKDGFFYTVEIELCDYPMPEIIFGENRVALSEQNIYYLEMIYELCQEHDTELLLVRSPFPCYEQIVGETNAVFDWAEEKGIPYVNFMHLTTEIDLNFYADTCDGGVHTNFLGARKVSHYLANYIIENHRDVWRD